MGNFPETNLFFQPEAYTTRLLNGQVLQFM